MSPRRAQRHPAMPDDDGLIIALSYRRVSRVEQKMEGLSLVAQTRESERYILNRDRWLIGQDFEDVLSGRRDDRVRYQQMLEKIRDLRQEGKQVVVVVVALDRLGRNMVERVRAYRELSALGVQIHSIREGGHVPEFVYNILAATAQEESRRTGERVRASRQVARQAGWVAIGRVPWGYRLRDATAEERGRAAPQKVYDLDPDQTPYAREAWRMLADGAHLRSIHRWVQNLPDLAVGGRAFTYSTLHDFFFSPTSVGRLGRYHDEVPVLQRPRGNWPPLIDDDTWRRAHLTLARHRRLPPRTLTLHLLSGFVRCPECGFRLSGRAGRPTTRGFAKARYNCQAHNGNREANGDCTFNCNATSLEADTLDQVRALFKALDEPSWRKEIEAAWERLRAPSASEDHERRVKQLQAVVQRNRTLATTATRQFAAGEITRERYDDLVEALDEESRRAREEAERLTGELPAVELPPLETVLGDLGAWREALSSEDVIEARAALAELVQKVVPVKRRHGFWTADIKWTPLGDVMKRVARGAEDT